MFSHVGDDAVAETGYFEEKNASIIIMGTIAQRIRFIRKLRRQPFGDCQK